MSRYKKVGKAMFHPVDWKGAFTAFDVAKENYRNYSTLDFWTDVVHYHHTGFVVGRPHLFVMGKPIEYEGRRGWFIQVAVGNLGELVSCFPCPLAFVAWCRNNDDDMRIVEWDAFMRKVGALYGYREQLKEVA